VSGIEAIPKNWALEVENADVLAGVGDNLATLSLQQQARALAG
jgi:hypothetical protein